MIVVRGKSSDGETPTVYSIDDNLVKNLEQAIKRNKRGWDYVAIVTGLPGVGKSTFTRYMARFVDEKFSNGNVYLDAEEMIDKASKDELYRSQVLDESFRDLGTSAVKSKGFFELVNWLQLSRQKRGFIFLILPDFFSLSKNLAIFRSSHLFVVYEDDNGERAFAAFDRERKKQLYILGRQFLNYNAVEPSFRGRFPMECQKGDIVNIDEYDKKKLQHLKNQSKNFEKVSKHQEQFDRLVYNIHTNMNIEAEKIADMAGVSRATAYNAINRYKLRYG